MNKGYVVAGLAAVIAVLLIVSVSFTSGRIDPARPDAATPTPQAEPAKPVDPVTPGNSGTR
ncbi:MAG: hypothetical protein B7Z15_11590 [Rhizobiales bacterium 32-66-8]|nr:MAG: hypothetical protein B7Z15_11590 [Rhizobiales bacterium 32-66-8]